MPITTLDGQAVGNGCSGPVYAALYDAYQRAKSREFAQQASRAG
jgi:D-alanine transaminase